MRPRLVRGARGAYLRRERRRRPEELMTDDTLHFGPAEKLAKDPQRLRRDFRVKIKRLAAKLPFAEDLLAAYYCAFDRETPRHVQAALIGAIAYFVVPLDVMPDVMPLLGFTDDAAVLATAIRLVASHIRPEHRAAAHAALTRGVEDDGADI